MRHASKITNLACDEFSNHSLSIIYPGPRDNWLLEETPAPPPAPPPPVSLLVLLLYQRSAGDVDRKKCPEEECCDCGEDGQKGGKGCVLDC